MAACSDHVCSIYIFPIFVRCYPHERTRDVYCMYAA
jgi:hypothetical protein